MHNLDNVGFKCSTIWFMSITPLTNPFPVPVEEEIAIFCKDKDFLPKFMGTSIL